MQSVMFSPNLLYIGLVVAACGAVLSLHALDQRHPNWVARSGYIAFILGVLLVIVPPVIRHGIILLDGFGEIMHRTVVAAQPQTEKDPR